MPTAELKVCQTDEPAESQPELAAIYEAPQLERLPDWQLLTLATTVPIYG